eukprot:360804-Chlamydomonas_euryale.AAC.4
MLDETWLPNGPDIRRCASLMARKAVYVGGATLGVTLFVSQTGIPRDPSPPRTCQARAAAEDSPRRALPCLNKSVPMQQQGLHGTALRRR